MLPVCSPGLYYAFVYTDKQNHVLEFDPNFDAESNNTARTAVLTDVAAANLPDLQVQSVTIPATGLSDQPLNVSWRIVKSHSR